MSILDVYRFFQRGSGREIGSSFVSFFRSLSFHLGASSMMDRWRREKAKSFCKLELGGATARLDIFFFFLFIRERRPARGIDRSKEPRIDRSIDRYDGGHLHLAEKGKTFISNVEVDPPYQILFREIVFPCFDPSKASRSSRRSRRSIKVIP